MATDRTTPLTRKRIQPHVPGYWTKREFAEAFGVTVETTDKWWARRYGPRRRSIGGKGVRTLHAVYKVSEVMEWLESQGSPVSRRRRS
jgi:hypothetical protein